MENFRTPGTKVPVNFRSRELSFSGNESSLELSFPGGRSKKRRDDGTLSRPRICKPLYGPSQGDETGDSTDDGIGLLHVIRLRYSIFIGGQTSILS